MTSGNSFYTEKELVDLGFRSIGRNVLISRKTSFYSTESISIGDYSRIDDYCVLSGKIDIGSHVNISASTLLFSGDAGITIDDYSSVSSRCAIYAITDDYSGEYMVNPTVNDKNRNVIRKPVMIEKYVVIGTGSTVLPGVTIAEGCSVGAMTLVKESIEGWGIYAGIPCRRIKDRSRNLLKYIEKKDL